MIRNAGHVPSLMLSTTLRVPCCFEPGQVAVDIAAYRNTISLHNIGRRTARGRSPAKNLFFLSLLSEEHSFLYILSDVLDRDPYLLHGIALTDGDALIGLALEIVSYAEGGSDLVLTAVALSYLTCLIIINGEVLTKFVRYSLCGFGELLRERENSALEGC